MVVEPLHEWPGKHSMQNSCHLEQWGSYNHPRDLCPLNSDNTGKHEYNIAIKKLRVITRSTCSPIALPTSPRFAMLMIVFQLLNWMKLTNNVRQLKKMKSIISKLCWSVRSWISFKANPKVI